MTSPTTEDQNLSEHLKPLRAPIAYGLLGIVGLLLLHQLVDLVWPGLGTTFQQRAAILLANGLIGTFTLGLPIVAVLIATQIAPVLQAARTITLIALIEYAVIGLLGLLSFAMGLWELFDNIEARSALLFLLNRVTLLALYGLGAFVVVRLFLATTPKPAVAPGYGYPHQQQYPSAQYPQQQYAQAAAAAQAQTAYAQQQAAAAQTAYAQQQAYGTQYGYGQQQAAQAQQQAAPSGGQVYGVASTAPTSAAPASGAPAVSSAPPASNYGQQAGQQAQQQAAQQQAQQAQQQAQAAWPPTPADASAAQWPPMPSAKASTEPSGSDQAQHTQVLRPDEQRGNAPA